MKFLREPLLHFVFLGAALFVVFRLVGGDGAEPGRIVVTRGRIEQFVVMFSRTWQRAPTREELEGLIRDYLREEVFSREAIAIGLDRDDTIIRRRLRQKMEFITDEVSGRIEPTEAELQAYLDEHPGDYRLEPRFTFRQVYLNPDRRGDALDKDAARLLAELRRLEPKADTRERGDRLMIEHDFTDAGAREVAATFGESFAGRLGELAPGSWEGPIESAYGLHLVLIAERTDGRLPRLDEVKESVQRDWYNARRIEAGEKLYAELLKKYEVTVDWPEESTETVGDAR